jgi:hypothetical protein
VTIVDQTDVIDSLSDADAVERMKGILALWTFCKCFPNEESLHVSSYMYMMLFERSAEDPDSVIL